jgi:hypothetical protein
VVTPLRHVVNGYEVTLVQMSMVFLDGS